YEDAFDRDYNGHNGYAGDPTCFSQPEAVRDDVITVCEMILAGNAEPETVFMLGRERLAVSHGCARVVFDK
ncbi:MAG: hypothetical protein Q4D59_06820, partial [Erysipelotrichaceae bacterium]|nr:hypothetical protein [Erysipelotrichaceae bacterium]